MAGDGSMTVSEAGRKGGLAVKKKYGKDFFKQIGTGDYKKGDKITQVVTEKEGEAN